MRMARSDYSDIYARAVPAPATQGLMTDLIESTTDETSGFASSAAVMVILSTVAGGINYASNIVFSRMLTPSTYGELTALFSLVVIITVPTSAAQILIAERLATLRAQDNFGRIRYLLRYAGSHVALLSLFVGVIYAAAIPLVVQILHIAILGPALATLPLLVVSFFVSFCQGVLQGLERFRTLGFMLVTAAAGRIVVGVPWALFAGGGAGGPLAGQALGNVAVILATWWAVRDLHLPRGTGAARSGFRRRIDARALWASLGFVAFSLLSNFDVILAKAFLQPAASGRYAALVTIERMILFLPGAVAIVTVPRAARARVAAVDQTRVLRTAALVVGASVVVAIIPAAIDPRAVLVLMFGHSYAGAAGGVLPIVIAGGGFAMLDLLIAYTVSIGSRKPTYVLLGMLPLQAAAISIFHQSAVEIAIVQAVIVTIAIVGNEIVGHPLLRRQPALISS
jgi:O-antigen/teichoic acid export membrane protein